eukprot:3805355-Prorocentrum_lima.AAC.1
MFLVRDEDQGDGLLSEMAVGSDLSLANTFYGNSWTTYTLRLGTGQTRADRLLGDISARCC